MKVLLFYAMENGEEYKASALLVFHACCLMDGFHDVLFDQHKFSNASFDSFVKTATQRFLSLYKAGEWDLLTNQCASIKAFCSALPERLPDFRDLIVPTIKVVSERTGAIRKNAATLLAKLSEEPENKKVMVANHGTEVLVSLKN